MTMRNKTLSAIVALSGLAAVAMPAGARVKKDATPLYKNASAPVEERVNDLLSRMTLEEKIMQLNQYTLGRNTVENNLREMAGAVPAEAGSVIYFSDDANLRNMMQKRCMEETRLGIPMIFGHDVIHGYRTIAPVPLAQAASWNPDLVRTISRDAAKEAYYGGLDWTVLGSPKPSYGPLYASSGTWNDANAQIKGRKRYPVRTTLLPPNKGTDSQTCEFIPLDQGTSFKGRITFHNLKECELGALIAALTFNGHPECCHSIGEAKPLGYGKVKISIDKLSVISIKDIFAKTDDPTQQETDYYFNKFKDVMTENIGTGWENSNSIRELCAMARGIDEEVNNNFSYMRMSTNRNENEFALNKSEKKENLPTFSSILNNRVLHITERPDTNRLFKQDIDNDIEEEDSQSLARIDVIETYTVRVPHLITNRDFCKAEKIISEMKRDINGKIRNLADQYQDQIDNIRENDYSTSRDEIIRAFNMTDNIVNGLNGQLNDEDRNNLINRIEQHINSFTELSQRYPNHAIEFMELIGRCNTLIQRIRNYGNGILPFLPISPFKGTLKAYTGKIDKYLREYRVLTDHDKDLIYNNIIEIYPSINAREKHPKRGSWSIDSMNNTLIRYLGDTRTTQLIDTLTQQ